jgi:UPF0755 protein
MKARYLILVAVIALAVIWWQPFNLGQAEVTVPGNRSAREIARSLAGQGVVRNVDEFLLWLRILDQERYLKAGTYELGKYRNPLYVIGRLTAGGRSEVIVTIPEGSTIDETARVLADEGLVDYDRFIALCRDRGFIADCGVRASSLEGYLFPDTYSFSRLQREESIITTMVHNFRRRTQTLGLVEVDSLEPIIILASLVEKEARLEEERPVIARVFLNRLRASRPLESCATVFYAMKAAGTFAPNRRLMDRDLRIDSPYNTYVHPGLPPGPICSPGESSIRAALAPAEVDYLYFVAKGDGSHYFSRTFKEHVAAKDRYQ